MNAPDIGAEADHAPDPGADHDPPHRTQLRQLADEQAALRRVATLVARGIDPVEIFSAVAEEAGQLLQVGQTNMIHYESDATSTVVASWRRTGKAIPSVGDRQRLGEKNLTTLSSQTRRPARIDSYADASGGPAVAAREAGFRSADGAPVIVQGRLWGAMIASSVDEHSLPLDTEARLASFTELVATAIAVELDVAALGRLPEPVEVAAYYVCSEALTNATRHEHASVVEVDAAVSGGTLRVRVRDDGVGGADPLRGSGLVGLKDRIEALGGTFSVHSPAGGGTSVSCELPVLASAVQPDPGPGESPAAHRCSATAGFLLAGSGVGRLPGRPGHDDAQS